MKNFKSAAKSMNKKAQAAGVEGRVCQSDLLGVLVAYGEECFYCGVELDFENGMGTFDHLIPKGRGGRNVKRNLVPSCETCNNRKAGHRVSYKGGRVRVVYA